MLVREAMTSPAVTVSGDDTVRRAASVLHRDRITAAPVLDAEGGLAGIVSEMDLLREGFTDDPRATLLPHEQPAAPPPARVADVMTRDVLTTTERADVARLAERMIRTRVKSVPVLRDGRVVGMLSRSDLLAALARPDATIRTEALSALTECTDHPHAWRITVTDGIAHISGPADDRTAQAVVSAVRAVPGVARVVLDRLAPDRG